MVDVVELDVDGATVVADGDGDVEAAVADAHVVERAQDLPREVAEFGVVPLGLEFRDDDDRQDDVVSAVTMQRPRVGEEHGGVEHVRPACIAHECHSRGRGGRLPPAATDGTTRAS